MVGRDAWAAIGAAAATLLVCVVLTFGALRTYAPTGDDLPLLVPSTRFFDPSPTTWFDSRPFKADYPEYNVESDNTVRPAFLASVYVDSWIAPRPDSPLMLTTNYIGHALCVALVYLLARRIFRLERRGALLAAALFFGTTAATAVFVAGASHRGDMLVALFALPALLVIQDGKGVRLLTATAFAGLAVFTKEAGLAIPVMLTLMMLWQRGEGFTAAAFWRARGALLALAAPLLAYAAIRIPRGAGGNYAIDELPHRVLGLPMLVSNPLRFLGTAFFPVETDTLKRVVSGTSGDGWFLLSLSRSIVAVFVSLATWATLILLVRSCGNQRRPLLRRLLVIGLLASVLPLTLRADPRFMYLSQALLLPLLVLVLTDISRSARPRFAAFARSPAVIALLLVVGPLYGTLDLLHEQALRADDNRVTDRLQSTILEEMRDPAVSAVYLVNATEFASPGSGLLNYLAAQVGREDLTLRVVNTLFGWDRQRRHATEGLSIEERPNGLRGRIVVGPNERLFSYVDPDKFHLGQPAVIEYGPIEEFATNAWGQTYVAQRTLEFSIPPRRGDVVVAGIDPASEQIYRFRWKPRPIAASIVQRCPSAHCSEALR